ncbi:MAG: HD domain-containing protein [Stackebrandtia sp.]
MVENARQTAERKLAEAMPRRWSHVQAVGAKAGRFAPLMLNPKEARLVTAAAWLHDVGYAPELATTGFHPLDGARWLRAEGWDERIACLVAHHTCATMEAEERGLTLTLESEFHDEGSRLTDFLLYADMTTGPEGSDVDVETRLDEVESRYGPGDVVTRFVQRARDRIVYTVRLVETELRVAGYPI